MNREIKFEYGFESTNGIVKKVYNLSEIPNIKEKCDVWNVLPIVYVRQHTGKSDKNGADLYEYDICKKWYYPYNSEPQFIICIIKYHIDGFQLINLNKKKKKYDLIGVENIYPMPSRINYKEWDNLEKIGSTYENPELLKG